jgi:hypothetical protein
MKNEEIKKLGIALTLNGVEAEMPKTLYAQTSAENAPTNPDQYQGRNPNGEALKVGLNTQYVRDAKLLEILDLAMQSKSFAAIVNGYNSQGRTVLLLDFNAGALESGYDGNNTNDAELTKRMLGIDPVQEIELVSIGMRAEEEEHDVYVLTPDETGTFRLTLLSALLHEVAHTAASEKQISAQLIELSDEKVSDFRAMRQQYDTMQEGPEKEDLEKVLLEFQNQYLQQYEAWFYCMEGRAQDLANLMNQELRDMSAQGQLTPQQQALFEAQQTPDRSIENYSYGFAPSDPHFLDNALRVGKELCEENGIPFPAIENDAINLSLPKNPNGNQIAPPER